MLEPSQAVLRAFEAEAEERDRLAYLALRSRYADRLPPPDIAQIEAARQRAMQNGEVLEVLDRPDILHLLMLAYEFAPEPDDRQWLLTADICFLREPVETRAARLADLLTPGR